MAGTLGWRDVALSPRLGRAAVASGAQFPPSFWPWAAEEDHPVPRLRHLRLASAAAPAFDESQDVQVPVCPLCNRPIPVKKGEIPDVVVGEHMDRDCRCRPGKKEKVFTFRCSKKGCKKKEMLPVACDQCHGNFCIQHRHPLDHSCTHGSRAVSIGG
ncbi:AN1-type zinc finger protein 2A isoform X1 [Myotis myotis]|uniref:AN1-type zinc finger protein 2A isoform X1 n=1 Tax=Myotis myotis TaxID=51298 RepID=UPI00174B1CF5|nr:AN1-type zinc finger protein 2A isoform X1 [Myotis myotis]